jgi:MinD superfamily P-loop ATPase
MILTIASGKGGTGKTTVAVNLALSLGDVQLLDCDVEEPDAHLFLKPTIEKEIPAIIPVPRVDKTKCTSCGKCGEVCEFHAIVVVKDVVLNFDELCHGCGACSYICPEDAISEVERQIGTIQIGRAGEIGFVQGILNIGEPMASPLIKKEKTFIRNPGTVILDAPPGTSCPVIETVRRSDFCLLVTEPTPFGLNDLELAVGMAEKLDVPIGVVVNRADVGDRGVWGFCSERDIPILMEIPMDQRIAELYSRGVPFVREMEEYRSAFRKLFDEIEALSKRER